MDCMPKAKAAALRAIELDDSLAETRVALGIYYSNFAWNLPAAEKEFRRAIELNPNYAPAHQQFGIECLSAMGRFDEAIAEGKRAEELDPASLIIGADLGNSFFRARRYDEAIEQFNRVLALDQNFSVSYWYLGLALHGKGDYAEAVAAYRKGLVLSDNPVIKALLIRSLTRLGEREEAVKLLNELQAESTRRYVSSSTFALAHGALGEKDKAFAFLDKEITDRSFAPVNIFIESALGRFPRRSAFCGSHPPRRGVKDGLNRILLDYHWNDVLSLKRCRFAHDYRPGCKSDRSLKI